MSSADAPALSPLLQTPGAVAGGGPDAGVAAHYGEPMLEQRALARGIGVVDLSHLDVVTVAGQDRLSWLNTLSSQALSDLAPGVASEMLLMDPKGHIAHAAAVLSDGELVWLITDSGRGDALAEFLESMRFMLRVEVGRPEVAVIGASSTGPRLHGADGGELPAWQDPWPRVGSGSTRYGPDGDAHPGTQWSGVLWLAPRADLAAVVGEAQAAGARLAGAMAWEAMRVASWRPRLNREVDERALPHELDWLRTSVHLDKGCYRGQETVARVFNLGKPPRRLVFLQLDGSDHVTPEVGDPVLAGEREVGRLTSVVRHHELGPVGLALVKRSVDPQAQLLVGGVAAAQEIIVGVDGQGTGRPEPVRTGLRRRSLGADL